MSDEHMVAIKAEQDEWYAIRDSLVAERGSVTAYQVTLEQRKRFLARGEKSATARFLASTETL